MAFDAGLRRTVLYGGSFSSAFVDTWTWDVIGWANVPGSGPGPRCYAAMAYDIARQRTVLFGDGTCTTTGNETWELAGNTWSLAATSGPNVRNQPAMAYDAMRGVTMLFGGNDLSTPPTTPPLDDLWEWDGDIWQQVAPTGPRPPVLSRHAMAYDTARRQVVLYGGSDGPTLSGETWVYPAQSVTSAFLVSGAVTGGAWSWCIDELPGPGGFSVCDLYALGAAPGASIEELVQAFVDSINASGCDGVDAVAYGNSLVVTVGGSQGFELCVGTAGQQPNCCVSQGQLCSFQPDMVELALSGQDCNGTGVDDAIDLAIGTSDDLNADNIPDECEMSVPGASQTPAPDPFGSHVEKNRYISMVIPPGTVTAIRVRLTSLHHPSSPAVVPDFLAWEGEYRWVNALNGTHTCPDSPNFQGSSFRCAVLGCLPEYRSWGTELGGEVLHVTGASVVPSSEYRAAQLASSCNGIEDSCLAVSAELPVYTGLFGDVNPVDDGLIVLDVARIVDHMKGAPYPTTWPPAPGTGMFKPRVHLRPNVPDAAAENVGVLDVATGVDAVKGNAYWHFGDLGPCSDACAGEDACP